MDSPLNKSLLTLEKFLSTLETFLGSPLRFDTKVTFNLLNSPKHGEKYAILSEYLELVKNPFSC